MSSSVIILANVQKRLALWLAAEEALSEGKEFWISGHRLIHEDLDKVAERIADLTRQEAQLLRKAAGKPQLSVKLARFSR